MRMMFEAVRRFMDVPIYVCFEEYNIAFTFTYGQAFAYSVLAVSILYFIFGLREK